MTTTYDIEDVLWKKLEASSLKTAITGKIRKRERPSGSSLEDVVINSLAVPNEQLQLAVANVNIFVPDKTLSEGQERVPDHARLKFLTALAISVLDQTMQGDYYWEVQQQQMIEDTESNTHFSNIRINFYSINLTN